MNIRRYPQFDFSGGLQGATSFLMKKPNELVDVRNGRFGVELGSAVRRNGYVREGSTFGAGGQNTPTGGYIAKFTTGNKRFVAVNNSGSTATIIRVQDSSTGVWSTLSGTTIPVNAKVFFFLFLDEVYITGYDPATGDPITPYNVDSTLDVSTTRNILNMPAGRYMAEYNGSLYIANVKIGSTRYKDRAYKSSGPLGAITFINGAQNGVLSDMLVDSVRYIKTGMALDVYAAGTDIKMADLVVTAVDKATNRVSFSAPSLTFAPAAVNTGTEVITLSSTTDFPTGQLITITSSGTAPGGLSGGGTYYVINVSATTIKLANTYAEAIAGTAINLTSQGTGTHTIQVYHLFTDNDEVWLDGRKNKLTVFWNQDFPTPETSDWTATRPGTDSSNEITGIGKSSNRLFLFTKNSAQKFDGTNTITFNNAVGCISQNSIRNIDDDWLVWCDARGRIWARNESSGQQEMISRGLYRKIMKFISAANLADSSAVVNNNTYYLYVGQNDVGNGNEYLRIVYSFDDNVWSVDRLSHPALFADNDDYSGENKPYFFSTDGYLYLDDTGNLDHDKAIPLILNTGRDNFGSEQIKKYEGVFIYSQDAIGTTVKLSVGGKQPQTVGEIAEDEQYIKFPERGEDAPGRGTTIDIFLSGAQKGDPPYIQGLVWYYSLEEDVPSERRPR